MGRFQIATSRPTTPTPNAIQLQTRKCPSRRVRKAREIFRGTRSEPTEGRGGEILMRIITLPLKKSNKHMKFFCPHSDDSAFCLETCESEYVCKLPKLVYKKWKAQPSFVKRFKKKENSLSSLEKLAERQLRRAHGEAGLISHKHGPT